MKQPGETRTTIYEAIVDCDDAHLPGLERQSGTIDPVLRVIIDNGYHQYEIDMTTLRTITIRKMQATP